ncbi:MAG: asparagine synthase-related protein [Candidatus Latescibacterota bacterium]
MPGLVGFTRPASEDGADLRLLERMGARLQHTPSCRREPPFADAHVCATRCLVGRVQPAPQPHGGPGLRVWLDGEVCNRGEVDPAVPSDPHLLEGVHARRFPEDLVLLDGIFAAVLYDDLAGKVHLVTDRHGLRPLYWARHPGGIAWSSEAKALLCLPGLAPRIDPAALESFLGVGYLHEDLTWFAAVRRVPAASVLTWDRREGEVRLRRYWAWTQLPEPGPPGRQDELADELGALFRAAVQRRAGPGERPVLLLSGGLDSRAILAALPEEAQAQAVTFGHPESADARIATRCAALKGVPHRLAPVDPAGWLEPRLQAVWWTDGMLDVLHMHGLEAMPAAALAGHLLLNGAGGDGLVGGGHLFPPHAFAHYLQERLGVTKRQHPELVAALHAGFARLGSAHAWYVDHRMRSFSVYGLLLAAHHGLDYRLPFMDNAFQERLYAVPVSLRVHNALYRRMLLRAFPAFYRTIPWQTSGVPLSWPPWSARLLRSWRRRRGDTGPGSVDYPAWLRQEPARTLCARVLLAPDALFPDFLPHKRVVRAWHEHQAGVDRTAALGRYLTLEVMLRQFLQGAWLPPTG